ncbi:hypothetical protein ACFY64_39295 [Streptomyces collinus]|uniref:hypothetical protein n=1 Tax=Streptomyces collinus TaxID=42684 RepID=UPI0036754CF0
MRACAIGCPLTPAATASATASASARDVNAGIALGSLIAGIALDSSLGLTGPSLVGMIMAALALVPLLALTAIRATRTDGTHPTSETGQDDSLPSDATHSLV